MVSTVTASTATAATTAIGVVAVIGLIAFLATKELASAGEGSRWTFLTRHLDVAVMPLLAVFFSIVVTRVLDVL